MKYGFDTSSMLEGYVRLYPPDVFPQLWVKIEKLVNDGHAKASEMVLEELERKDDDVLKWAKSQSGLFLPVDMRIQELVIEIMREFPRIVAEGGTRNMADPFVVAFAKQHAVKVITAEIKPGSRNKPTIPFICDHFKIPYISFLDLIREENWSF